MAPAVRPTHVSKPLVKPRRDAVMLIRVRPEEKIDAKRQAAERGVTLSHYVRIALQREAQEGRA